MAQRQYRDAAWWQRHVSSQRGMIARLARQLNIDPSNASRIVTGERTLKRTEAEDIARLLGVPVTEVLVASGMPTDPPASALPPPAAALPALNTMPLDVPVLGTAACSFGQGAFQLAPDVIDRVRRPPGVAGAADIYAIFVEGDSMEPRYEPGDLVYVSPHRPVRSGDYVVIQLQNGDDDTLQAYLKRLISRSDRVVKALQLNPEAEMTFDGQSVRAVHRVLSMADLFGL
jgi:phage repressor protein C with HTH and peptisase S24 domain